MRVTVVIQWSHPTKWAVFCKKWVKSDNHHLGVSVWGWVWPFLFLIFEVGLKFTIGHLPRFKCSYSINNYLRDRSLVVGHDSCQSWVEHVDDEKWFKRIISWCDQGHTSSRRLLCWCVVQRRPQVTPMLHLRLRTIHPSFLLWSRRTLSGLEAYPCSDPWCHRPRLKPWSREFLSLISSILTVGWVSRCKYLFGLWFSTSLDDDWNRKIATLHERRRWRTNYWVECWFATNFDPGCKDRSYLHQFLLIRQLENTK